MQKLLTYEKSGEAYLAGQVVDGENWVTNGHWLAREQYVELHPAEIRLSIEQKGVWSGTTRGIPSEAKLKKTINGIPPADRIDAMLMDVFVDFGPQTSRFIVPESGEGFGVMVQERYLCQLFLELQIRISMVDPLAGVMFMAGDEIHAVLMPMRVPGETISELNVVAAAMSRADELVGELAAARSKEAATRTGEEPSGVDAVSQSQ